MAGPICFCPALTNFELQHVSSCSWTLPWQPWPPWVWSDFCHPSTAGHGALSSQPGELSSGLEEGQPSSAAPGPTWLYTRPKTGILRSSGGYRLPEAVSSLPWLFLARHSPGWPRGAPGDYRALHWAGWPPG